jgi:hypothetical protein
VGEFNVVSAIIDGVKVEIPQNLADELTSSSNDGLDGLIPVSSFDKSFWGKTLAPVLDIEIGETMMSVERSENGMVLYQVDPDNVILLMARPDVYDRLYSLMF